MPVPAVFPARIPTAAPANSIIPFTRPPLPLSGGQVPLSGMSNIPPTLPRPTAPAPQLPQPSIRPTGFGGGISTLPGSASPAAVAAAEAGFGAVAARAVGGAAGLLLGDLLFPQPVANAEAPAVDPSLSPLINPPRSFAPITSPVGGIRSDGVYGLTTDYLQCGGAGCSPNIAQTNYTETSGAFLGGVIRGRYDAFDRRTEFDAKRITGMAVVQLAPGTGTATPPNYEQFQNPNGSLTPLQNPVPVDSEGNRRAFVPPPAPVIVPFKRPTPAPVAPPIPTPAPVAPPIPAPEVIPEKKPDLPPYTPPVPYNPAQPVPTPPFVPFTPPSTPPFLVPPFLPVPEKRGKLVAPLKPPPDVYIPTQPPPTSEKGFYVPPPPSTLVPPLVPPSGRTRGSDCCDVTSSECPDVDLDEVIDKLEKILECVCIGDREVNVLTLGIGTSGVYSLPPETLFVEVKINEVASQVRSQSGNAEGKDIYFVGSYSFGAKSCQSDRKPLSYIENIFPCSKLFDRFVFQTNYGSQAEVKAYYLAPKN